MHESHSTRIIYPDVSLIYYLVCVGHWNRYDALSDEMKSELSGLHAVHSFEKGFADSLAAPGGRERLKDMLNANPAVVHPVLRTHPESGRTSLFVNGLFTSHIVGMGAAESDALLEKLYAHMEKPEFRCRFQCELTSNSVLQPCMVYALIHCLWFQGRRGQWRSGTTGSPSTAQSTTIGRSIASCSASQSTMATLRNTSLGRIEFEKQDTVATREPTSN
jgi:hypothetical protein